MLELSQEEVTRTITRATEIVEQQNEAPQKQDALHKYEAYVTAAEEIGIPREAMLQALRESTVATNVNASVGDMVFAPSVDKSRYPAVVLKVNPDSTVVVQFVSGGEHTVPSSELRPFAIMPGTVVQFQDENAMGAGFWCTGKVMEYNAYTRSAKLTYVGTRYTIPLSRIRMKADAVQKQKMPTTVRSLVFRTAVVAGTTGTLLGALLEYLLHSR